jgi:hypothetical protein
VYVAKGEKFFVLGDSYGYFTILKRDGTFRSRFTSGSSKVLNMDRLGLNIIYSTPHSVGFIKFLESSAGSITCDVGRQTEITAAYLDLTLSNIVYAAATNGQILVFDSHAALHRADVIECKMIGRFETNVAK